MTPRKSILATWTAALALLAVFAVPAFAQSGKITGIVTDAATGQPLPGAQVFVEGAGFGTLTGDNGRFFLINVPPGTYTVVSQLIGYATMRRENVLVAIDVTRQVNFEMQSEAVALEEVIVQAERVPLVELQSTGSSDVMTAQELESLPVDNIAGALELKAGFMQVPSNTDVISFAQERQGVTPLRIRGGRGAETLTLIDGIPVNNFVLGGPALSPSVFIAEQVDFIKGGFEPQYGNALSGFVNIATREGGTELDGAIDYRTNRFGDLLGNGHDQAGNEDAIQGFISGPVPGTGERLRFMVAGQQSYGPDRILEFDDDVFVPTQDAGDPDAPHALDVVPGWRQFGFDNERQAFSKLTWYVTPAAKLSGSWLTYTRQTKGFDFRWMFAGTDPLEFQPTGADSAFYGGENDRNRLTQFLSQNSVKQDRNLYVLNWDHTLGRTAYKIAVGRFDQERLTCNVAEGLCLGNVFEDPNFDGSGFVRDGQDFTRSPTTGMDRFFGGETIETLVGRADVQTQLTDHHNLKAGVFYQSHDVVYDEWECGCINSPNRIQNFWQADPWDMAAYVQDDIEYDFITIRLGFRFDYGKANGVFLANPLDPNNGTTALHACADPARFGHSGALDCADLDDRAVAAELAAQDDFADAEARSQFSPRIGVNLPVTESSSLFFNFGRFSQNPIINNLFRNTNIGTDIEGTSAALNTEEFEGRAPFLGNPQLAVEETSSYEVGFMQEIGDVYALTLVGFAKDQFGLTGVRTVGQDPFPTFDPGATFGSNNPTYLILVNGDFSTTRGIEASLRRRLTDFWGFDMSYQYSRATTNAADPERERERLDLEGDNLVLEEVASEIDQPHVFRGTLRFATRDEAPPLGPLSEALRNSRIALTAHASSGLPYTPIKDFNGGIGVTDRLPRNSARAPSQFFLNLRAERDLAWSNVDYTLYLDVRNLLDNKYCIQVFESTGDCEAGTEDQSRRRVSNGFGEGAASTVFDRPQFFGPRRTIAAGLRVNF